jgi:hypothetical protein
MPSSWIWRRFCLVRTDISEEGAASIFGIEIINELGTAVAVTSK